MAGWIFPQLFPTILNDLLWNSLFDLQLEGLQPFSGSNSISLLEDGPKKALLAMKVSMGSKFRVFETTQMSSAKKNHRVLISFSYCHLLNLMFKMCLPLLQREECSFLLNFRYNLALESPSKLAGVFINFLNLLYRCVGISKAFLGNCNLKIKMYVNNRHILDSAPKIRNLHRLDQVVVYHLTLTSFKYISLDCKIPSYSATIKLFPLQFNSTEQPLR